MSLLSVRQLAAYYGDFQALFAIDFEIEASQTIALIGANGAGKSTLLKTITGLLNAPRETIYFDGTAIGGLPAYSIVKRGIAMVPEGRRLFPSLSVGENLLMGAKAGRSGPWTLERVYRLFPMLQEFRHNRSTALSGGQQQMVAIGRALLSNPKLLLCDELSLGLAPVVIKDIYAMLPQILSGGASLVLVEQDINQAMQVADRLYCLQEGRISLHGKPDELSRAQISAAYFGI